MHIFVVSPAPGVSVNEEIVKSHTGNMETLEERLTALGRLLPVVRLEGMHRT